jgi:predicted phosphoribosyltransferase
VLALPRGGTAIGAEVAKALEAPLDLLLVRKIGLPSQPELAMGAVVDGKEPFVVRNEEIIEAASISEAEFRAACATELVEIERRRQKYLGDRERVDVQGRTVIVVDDGIATGATARAALRAVRARNPARVVLAVPVAPSDSLEMLRKEADELVCLESHAFFGAIGLYYNDFRQVSDAEVIDILRQFPVSPSRKTADRGYPRLTFQQ